jgi:hypothetical protein
MSILRLAAALDDPSVDARTSRAASLYNCWIVGVVVRYE